MRVNNKPAKKIKFCCKSLATLARYCHSISEEGPKTAKHIPDNNKKPIAKANGEPSG